MMRDMKAGEGFRLPDGTEVIYQGRDRFGRALLDLALPDGAGVGDGSLLALQYTGKPGIGRRDRFMFRFAAGVRAEFF